MLVSTENMKSCAFSVDGISDQRQVVIKSLQGEYGDIVGVSAATILGDGKIALIVDPDGITSEFEKRKKAQRVDPVSSPREAEYV